VTYITKLIFFLFLFTSSLAYAERLEINEIYIEATGNNNFEAKIKAQEQGNRRAFFLVTDKFGMNVSNFKEPNAKDLTSVFKPFKVSDEVLVESSYKATVSYSYNRVDFYRLLMQYGDAKIQDMFNEYLIIPVFKQRNVLNIWNKDDRWNDFWLASSKRLARYRLFCPEKTLHLSKIINDENIFKLSYDDFASIFPDKLFKKVMIVTAELFTDRQTTQTLMIIKRHIISQDPKATKIIQEQFNLTGPADIQKNVDTIINKTIAEYGGQELQVAVEDKNMEIAMEDAVADNNVMIMLFEAFDEAEVQEVIAKLKKVKEIDSFEVKNNGNDQYIVRLNTNASEEEVARGLYTQSLSYRQKGNVYKLIDIQKGN